MDLARWIFLGAGAIGLSMFVLRVVNHANPPRALAFLHGLVVLCGVGVLVHAMFNQPHPARAGMALLLLGIAGTAGAYLAFVDTKGELVPVDQVVVHGALATAGVLTVFSLAATC